MTSRFGYALAAFRPIFAAAVLAIGPAVRAEDAPPAPTIPPPPPALTQQQKDALAVLDKGFTRFDSLLAKDDDARHHADEKAIIDDLKKRVAALRASFDQSKCDDLKTELILDYQRLAAWMAKPLNPPDPAKSGG
jgi:hypothetical protein